MEYSVYDLIKILLRRWYVVLIIMCLVGGASAVLAQRSYADAIAQYDAYTSKTVPVTMQVGDTIAIYRYHYEITDISKYVEQAKTRDDFMHKYIENNQSDILDKETKPSIYKQAAQDFEQVSSDFTKLLTDVLVIKKSQYSLDSLKYTEPLAPDKPLGISEHLLVEEIDQSTLRITVSGLNETMANAVMSAYLQGITDVGVNSYSMQITVTKHSSDFFQNSSLTDSAKFSQTVMHKPEKVTSMVKAIGTGAAFAFVFVCFGILLVTFIKDTRSGCKKP